VKMTAAIIVFACGVLTCVQGCGHVLTDTARNREASSVSVQAPEPPASVTDQITARLSSLSPAQAVRIRDDWGIADTAVFCAGSGDTPAEAVLVCQWGKGHNSMQDGRALFWLENGAWRVQPYPSEGVDGRGDFREIRREGDLLQVIMNVSGGETRLEEQVGLLQFHGGGWQAVWGPKTTSPDAQLSLVFQPPGSRVAQYTLFRDEEGVYIREDWERQGLTYVQTRRLELSQEEYVAIRFILAFLSNNEIELAYWGTPEAVESAQHLGLAQALQDGFTTKPPTLGIVEVNAVDLGEAWHFRVARRDMFWKITEIQITSPDLSRARTRSTAWGIGAVGHLGSG